MAVVILSSSRTKAPQYASGSPEDMEIFVPWSEEHQTRLMELLAKPYAQALIKPLNLEQTSTAYKDLNGVHTFRDQFSDRQLLVGLEFMSAILEACQQMKLTGLPVENVNVLTTYLALLLGFIVENNSRLCSWSGRGRPSPSFARLSYFAPSLFVERVPDGTR